MRAFTDYLTESAKKYMFRVRVATKISSDQMDRMKSALEKYDCDGISEPKRLPITQKTLGFDHLNHPEVYVVDVVTNYPCSPIELQALFHSAAGIPSGLVMVTTPNQEVLAAPIAPEAGEGKAILDKSLPKNTYPQILADLEQAVASKEDRKYQYTYAATKTKSGETTNDLAQGNISPVGSKQNKIPKPPKR